jgi:hypothetical protein
MMADGLLLRLQGQAQDLRLRLCTERGATVWRTLQGYEVMHMIRKGQMRGVEKGDSMGQVAFISSLFGVAA